MAFACLEVDRLESGVIGKAPDRDVDITWVDLETARDSAGTLSGEERCAAAHERIEHDAVPPRAVENRVGDEGDRLDGRMHGEFGIASGPKGIDAGIAPNV